MYFINFRGLPNVLDLIFTLAKRKRKQLKQIKVNEVINVPPADEI